MPILRVFMRAHHKTAAGVGRAAGEAYLVEIEEARELRAAGVLEDRFEVCLPQVTPPTAAELAELEALFAPPPPPPVEEVVEGSGEDLVEDTLPDAPAPTGGDS
jgi:hypothetical protein